MNDFHLISHDLCPYVQRAVIVLNEKQIPHRRSYIDLASKPEWFRALSPLGRVPVLQTGTRVLFESQVIAEYLDEITPGSLHPTDPLEKARHRSWIEYGSEVLKAVGAYYAAPDGRAEKERSDILLSKVARIETELQGPFFGGPEFSMIDGVWGTIFRYFDTFDQLHGRDFLQAADRVAEWRRKIETRASVRNAVPEGYPARLTAFLARRDGPVGELARARLS